MAQSKAPPFTLYEYRPSPFCVAVRIALNEVGALFTPREVDLKKPRTAAFLKRSPFGRLPALVEHRPAGELAVFESPAILLYLADRFPESSLGFSDITSRGEGYSWLSYISSGFADELWKVLHESYVYEEEEKSIAVLDRSHSELERHLEVLDKHLARRAYLSGDYSPADTLATPLLDLLDFVDLEFEAYPRVRAWRERLRDRPSYKEVWPHDD
ncbi:MAG: glutathione S-transferase family protein [Deltaproteobacteria bacterium]|nr:glutathione S-transferase family protein [Deltaproteobacteria bacterium]